MHSVLIVDDERDIRDLIAEVMQRKGYSTFLAGDGYEALQALRDHQVDIVVSDIMMPRLDGLSLIREIRRTSTVPVILLSARNDDVDKIWGLGIGADDYIVKPVSLNELVARIEAQIRRNEVYGSANRITDAILSKGGFELNTESCEVMLDGYEIILLAKEFKLLSFFLENTERVFTKKQLYRAVWDGDYCFDDNTVTVTISRLRGKIEKDGKKYIHTIRGLGYKLSLRA